MANKTMLIGKRGFFGEKQIGLLPTESQATVKQLLTGVKTALFVKAIGSYTFFPSEGDRVTFIAGDQTKDVVWPYQESVDATGTPPHVPTEIGIGGVLIRRYHQLGTGKNMVDVTFVVADDSAPVRNMGGGINFKPADAQSKPVETETTQAEKQAGQSKTEKQAQAKVDRAAKQAEREAKKAAKASETAAERFQKKQEREEKRQQKDHDAAAAEVNKAKAQEPEYDRHGNMIVELPMTRHQADVFNLIIDCIEPEFISLENGGLDVILKPVIFERVKPAVTQAVNALIKMTFVSRDEETGGLMVTDAGWTALKTSLAVIKGDLLAEERQKYLLA